MTQDEIIRLVLQIQGAKDMDEARAAAGRLKEGLEKTADSADKLRGERGRGMLGASYAIQDFMSVLTMGGGIDRALMSISNNIDQMARAAGASVEKSAALSIAFTGFVSVLPLVIPLLKELWEAIKGGDAAEQTKERLKEIQAEIERTRKEFEKLRDAPKDFEKEAASGFKMFLEGPRAGQAGAAVLSGLMRDKGMVGRLSGDLQKFFQEVAGPEGMETDEALAIRAEQQAAAEYSRAGGEGPTPRHRIEGVAKALRERREAARQKGFRALADRAVAGATVPGAAGEGARRLLREATRGTPGFEELELYTPERIEQAEAEYAESQATDEEENRQVEAQKRQRKRAAGARRKAFERAKRSADVEVREREREQGEQIRQVEDQFMSENRQMTAEAERRARAAAQDRKRAQAGAARSAPRDDVSMRDIHKAGFGASMQMQQRVFQQTGQRITQTEAARMILQARQQEDRAMEQFVSAVMQAAGGGNARIRMLQQATQRLRQGSEQSPMPSGLQR